MTTLRPFLPLILLLIAIPAHAATLTADTSDAAVGAPFVIQVYLNPESESVNAVEGYIHVPEGITIDTLTSAGSALDIFVHDPSYGLSDRMISFTGGSTHGLATQKKALLFIIRAHADTPGSYSFKPTGFVAYRSDGSGTGLSVSTQPISVLVGEKGSAPPAAPITKQPAKLTAEVGRDTSLFDGNYFLFISGGDSGSGVDHYLVREGWFGTQVRSDRFYVLQDQKRENSMSVTAVNRDGKQVTMYVLAPNPWKELGMLVVALILFSLVAGALIRRLGGHKRS